MCFSLMGFVNDDADYSEVQKISLLHQNYYQDLDQYDADIPHHFPRIEGTIGFVLHAYCDCGSKVGGGDSKQPELQNYVAWLNDLSRCSNLRFLYLAKVWDSTETFEPTQIVPTNHSKEKFLANMQENTPYLLSYVTEKGTNVR